MPKLYTNQKDDMVDFMYRNWEESFKQRQILFPAIVVGSCFYDSYIGWKMHTCFGIINSSSLQPNFLNIRANLCAFIEYVLDYPIKMTDIVGSPVYSPVKSTPSRDTNSQPATPNQTAPSVVVPASEQNMFTIAKLLDTNT